MKRLALALLLLIYPCGLIAPHVADAQQSSPFTFQVAIVDATTGVAKGNFYLGEPIAAVFTLTNQSNVSQSILSLEQTNILVTLSGSINGGVFKKLKDGVLGGRGQAQVDSNGSINFSEAPPVFTTLAPGQKAQVRIDDLASFFSDQLEDGSYTLNAAYNQALQSQASFTITIDEARSVPVLEQMAAGPDGDNKVWANVYLDAIRMPSVKGRITDSAGRAVPDVTILVTGSKKTNLNTKTDGRYSLVMLTSGGNYTLTPELEGYTFQPASRTFTNLTTKQVNINFTATRTATGANLASEETGVTASSTLSEDYPAQSVIDGSNSGAGWGHGGGGWSDGTQNVFPDWIEVNFGSTKPIDSINVYTVQDNYTNPSDPTLTQTFSLYGITNFDVQYWNGVAWVTVLGGAVNGNNKVWRKLTFPTVNTSKIRVNVRNALGGYSRITEIEAFHVNVPPTVSITGTYTGQPGDSIHFNSSATDTDGTIRSYAWDFGDGTSGTTSSPTHIYATAGTYKATLVVTDDAGDSGSATTTVKISNPLQAPVASPGGPYTGIAGDSLLFQGHNSSDADGWINSYQWNLGIPGQA